MQEEKGGGKPQATKLHFPPRPLPQKRKEVHRQR